MIRFWQGGFWRGLALAVLAGIGLPALAAVSLDEAALERKLAAGEVDAVRQALRQALLKESPAVADRAQFQEALKRLLKDPDYTLWLARHEFLSECDAAALAEFLKKPEGPAVLAAVLADRDWLEQLLHTGGLWGQGADVLDVLAQLRQADPGVFSDPFNRKLATAVAVAFGASSSRNPLKERGSTPVGRYSFFKKAHQERRLHKMFDDFEPWEMYYPVATPTDDASLSWILDHVNIPLERYTEACWMAEYRGNTIFGGNIQTPYFYQPWDGSLCSAEKTSIYGGVCGSLSYYGTQSAGAHGIPAMPMGQPGHCAYGVRFARGDWRGGFGGPYGGAHVSVFGKISGHTDFVFLAEEVFSQWPRLVLARRASWQAQLYPAKDQEKARAAFSLALLAQDRNPLVWKDLVAWMKGAGIPPEEWVRLSARLGKAIPRHPYAAVELVREMEKPYLDAQKDKGKDPAPLVNLWAPVFLAAGAEGEKGWYSWQTNALWTSLFERLGKNAPARGNFLSMLLASAVKEEKLFAAVIGWSQEALKEKPEEQEALLKMVGKVLSGGAGAQFDDAKGAHDLYAKLVLLAENNKSMPAFQGASRMGQKFLTDDERAKLADKPPPKPGAVSGELLSPGGLLRISSTSGWDRPLLHAGILTESLGFFHTEKGKNPWAEVALPKLTEPSTIIVVACRGNEWRVAPLELLVSEDGEGWTSVGKLEKYQELWRVDLNGRKLRARYVKVQRGGDGDDVFHLRGILVYGRRLQ